MVVLVLVRHLLPFIMHSKDVLDPNTPYDFKVYIVRSLVATREIGFLAW